MDQRIINLYDRFTHGGMNRRQFLDRLAELTGSAAAASALVPLLQSNYAKAATVPADDPRLAIETTGYDTPAGKVSGYLARLKGEGQAAGRGRDPREPRADAAHPGRHPAPRGRRLPRLRHRSPLHQGRHAERRGQGTRHVRHAQSRRRREARRGGAVPRRARGVRPAMSARSASAGAAAWSTGWRRRARELKAGVAYYGRQIPDSRVSAIRASLLLHYAGLDEPINAGIPAYEKALREGGKRFTVHVYPNVNHAFNNDTGAARYNKEAAGLAWGRTLAFFKENWARRKARDRAPLIAVQTEPRGGVRAPAVPRPTAPALNRAGAIFFGSCPCRP